MRRFLFIPTAQKIFSYRQRQKKLKTIVCCISKNPNIHRPIFCWFGKHPSPNTSLIALSYEKNSIFKYHFCCILKKKHHDK